MLCMYAWFLGFKKIQFLCPSSEDWLRCTDYSFFIFVKFIFESPGCFE